MITTKTMLPPYIKQNVNKLLEALRSGEYLQGMSVLKNDTGEQHRYCCLGVAVESVLDTEIVAWNLKSENDGKYILNGSWGLTNDDANKFGFLTPLTKYEYEKIKGSLLTSLDATTIRDRHVALMNLNDSHNSFEFIADLIEEFGWNEYGEVIV